ncbi:MAG: ATP-binding cassette domain-containing protein [Nannocystis sp.]|uniref:ATP-binding cassette domain-containing protein n=1 Tax=Nannocystis sp. TaxID=1962667 RepID=UPI002424E11F|nr:ATP-binding cassette domain-containing protein [Nannocystis sp.]MBK9755258.1 ATP-binding cassette domain-containing protein [Nannocystis sp.]
MNVQGARLIVRDGDAAPVQVPLERRPMTIGRTVDNDIVVTASFLAAHHARVEPVGADYRIVDLGGACGIMFGGQRIGTHTLRHNDVIRIGDPLTGSFVTLLYQRSAQSTMVPAATPITRIPLEPRVTTIGREGTNVTLASPLVSRAHAEVGTLPGGGHVLRDLGSTNGTFVGGQRITTPRLLQPGVLIQIGPFKLAYDGSSLLPFDQRGAMTLEARDLVRTVAGGRTIISGISLIIRPREFVAIVGGSGSGKSTLLKALSGFARASSGAVYVNGDDYYGNFDAYRGVLGYVPQHDILHGRLRVEEALRYTAELRLPADTEAAEIEARVARVLDDVDMTAHRRTRIDQLSGGQRKRVSIAAELLADPSLFFLDEPTSGLDPGLEKKMMYTLRRLADAGRTVVLVTHATANIQQCDHVLFLAEGRMVFFGPPRMALRMFHVSSGDFADIYTKLEGVADPGSALVERELRREYEELSHERPPGAPVSLAELWALKFRRGETYARFVHDRLQRAPPRVRDDGEAAREGGEPAASVTATAMRLLGGAELRGRDVRPAVAPVSGLRQFGILTRRYLRLLLSDQRNLVILLLQAPIIGGILLLVAKEDALQNLESSHGRLVLFLLALVAVWFGILNSAREISKEEEIFRRERLASLKVGPYVASKVFVLAALCFVQSVVLLLVLAIKVDFSAEVVEFTGTGPVYHLRGEFLAPLGFLSALGGTIFLTSITGLGLGLLISSAANTSDRAMSIIPIALVPQIVFALALMPLPASVAWVSYLTSSRFAMEALGALSRLPLPRDYSNCVIPGNPRSCAIYPTVDYDPSVVHVLQLWGTLAAYAAVCLTLTTAILVARDRQRH